MIENLGQPIALGRTAEIYAWHNDQVLKLFYDWFGLENIETEQTISRAVHASGLPTPQVGEIISMDGRHGLVYERVEGNSMWKLLQHKPWNALRYCRRMAELHVAVHNSVIPTGVPSQRKTLELNIRQAQALPNRLRQRTLAALARLPDGNLLCHGDFWPSNLLVTGKGVIIIDWFRATYGNPLADLARTTNLLLGFTGTPQSQRPFLSFGSSYLDHLKNSLFRTFCRMIYPTYIRYYFELSPGGEQEYRRWLPIVAAARLADNIPELEQMLVGQVENDL